MLLPGSFEVSTRPGGRAPSEPSAAQLALSLARAHTHARAQSCLAQGFGTRVTFTLSLEPGNNQTKKR